MNSCQKKSLARSVCDIARCSFCAVSLALTGGCASAGGESNPHEIDWKRVNNIESNAQRYGAQIIWLRYPERSADVVPANLTKPADQRG